MSASTVILVIVTSVVVTLITNAIIDRILRKYRR